MLWYFNAIFNLFFLYSQRIPQQVDPLKQGRVQETSVIHDNSRPCSDDDMNQDICLRDVNEQRSIQHVSSSSSRVFHHDATRKGKGSSTLNSFGRGLADLDSQPGR